MKWWLPGTGGGRNGELVFTGDRASVAPQIAPFGGKNFFFLPHDGKAESKTEIWGREEGSTIRDCAKIKMDMKTKHLEGNLLDYSK